MKKHRKSKMWVAVYILLLLFSVDAQQRENLTKQKKINTEINKSFKKTGIPKPKGFLNDYANVLDKKDKQEIENVLRELQSRAKVQFAVAIVDSTKEMSIFDYSLAVSRNWKIGLENGGILLVVAVKDKKWHIQIDKHLEQNLSNDEVKQIGELMIAEFQQKNYGNGIKKCIEKMIYVLANKLHFAPFNLVENKFRL